MENQIKQNYENFLSKEKFNESQINYKKINLENFFKKGFPNKRQEDWKFSDLNQIIETNIENLNYISEIDNKDNIEQKPIKDFDHNKIFIVNGQIVKSDLTHEDENKIMISEDQLIEEDDQKNSFLIITHYQRLLDYIKPDHVHVLKNGQIIKSGGPELALNLEKIGYEDFN